MALAAKPRLLFRWMKGVDCLQQLIKAFSEDLDFQTIISGFKSGMKEQLVSGLSGSSRQVMISALKGQLDQPIVILTHNMFSAQKIAEDLIECLSADQILLYPAQELMLTEAAIASPELLAQRIDALSRLASGFRGIFITPFAGLRKLLPLSQVYTEAQIRVSVGDQIQIEEFLLKMTVIGYERVERVEAKGEMSVRKGIIADQRRYNNAAQHASELLQEQLAKMTDKQAKNKLKDGIGHEIAQLQQHHHFPSIYKYIACLLYTS